MSRLLQFPRRIQITFRNQINTEVVYMTRIGVKVGQLLDQFGRQILVKEEFHASTTIKRFSRSAA